MPYKFRKSVFIVVYSRRDGGLKYLILKRKKHWTGWEFPKGGREKGEKIIHTVKREVKEESGLEAMKIKRFNKFGLYRYEKIFPDRPGFIGQSYSLWAAEVGKGKAGFDPSEHSDCTWMDFEKAVKKVTWPNQKKCLKKVNLWLEKEQDLKP